MGVTLTVHTDPAEKSSAGERDAEVATGHGMPEVVIVPPEPGEAAAGAEPLSGPPGSAAAWDSGGVPAMTTGLDLEAAVRFAGYYLG